MKKFLIILTVLLLGIACAGESVVPALPYEAEAVLYYPSQDDGEPVAVSRVIPMGNDKVRSCIEALFEAPFAKDAVCAAPAGTYLSLYEYDGDAVTLGLSATAPCEKDAAVLFARCAALTVRDNSMAEAVNVLLDGMCVSCLLTEEGDAAVTGETAFDAFTLYLPSTPAGRLYTGVEYVEDTGADRTGALIDRLFVGEKYGDCAAFPVLARPYAWERSVTEDGRYCLDLYFSMNAFRTLGMAGYQKWQLVSSLAMTCVTNLEGIERVRVLFDGEPLSSFPSPSGTQIDLPGGAAGRNRFSSLVYARVGAGNAYVPLGQVMRGEAILTSAIEGLNGGDLRSVTVIGDTAYIDLSSAYAGRITDGRSTLYRMIGAVCFPLNLNQVQFLVDGAFTDEICGISVIGPLLYNPGF